MNKMPARPLWADLPYRQCIAFYAQYLAEAGASTDLKLAHKKYLAENDLFFLLCFVLRRPDMLHPFIFARCREFQADPDEHIDLWAREHGKSTVITFAGTIMTIIHDPEITIGLFSHTKPVAKKFLSQLKAEMEQNTDLPLLWPDVFWEDPARQAEKWSEDTGIIVKRNGNPKEATIEAHGLVDGQPTGRHFKLRLYDDVVTLESVSTPEQIAKTTHAFQMSDNLGAIGGAQRIIGTRYHLFDTYRTMIDDKIATPRIYPATDDGTETGKAVFMPQDHLMKKRRAQGPYVFNSQMLLNPTADKSMGFREDWLSFDDIPVEKAMSALWRFIIVDPAGSKQRKNNDYTTFWVIGYGADSNYRVLDIRRDRMNLSKRTETLFELHQQWKPGLVAYEEYGMQADIEHIQYVQKEKLYEFDIKPLGGSMPKTLRILRLVPLFENGWKEGSDITGKSRIILPTKMLQIDHNNQMRDLVQDFIRDEYTAFPVLKHDDMLDSLSRIVDLEADDCIQTPTITVGPPQSTKIAEMMAKTNRTQDGANSWLTV